MTVTNQNLGRPAARGLAAALTASTAHAQIAGQPIPGDPVTIDSGRVTSTVLAPGVHDYFGIPSAGFAVPVQARQAGSISRTRRPGQGMLSWTSTP